MGERRCDTLHSTNNFPEFTGRICPAPCEASCTLNIDDNPVTIKTIECAIVDRGWEEGWIRRSLPAHRTGKRVAVVGSGPAGPGLRAATGARRSRRDAVREERPHRRPAALRHSRFQDGKAPDRPPHRRRWTAEGVEFRTAVEVGVTLSLADRCCANFDAVVLTGGAEWPRDLEVPGPRACTASTSRWISCTQQNKRVAGDDEARAATGAARSRAKGKHVVVIGGGDTGSDCIGTSTRQGAASITQLEILPQPPEQENKALTWPDWPLKLRTSSSQEEGCERDWAVLTKTRRRASGRRRGARMRARRMGQGRRWPHGDAGSAGQRVPAEGRSRAAGDGLPRAAQAGHGRAGAASRSIRAATCGQHGRLPDLGRRRSSPPATCGAASRWSSGRSAKAANAPARSTSS